MLTTYKQEISNTLTHDYTLSYDLFDFERASFNSEKNAQWNLSHREDEYLGKVLLNWELSDEHTLAFGGELSHEIFGLDSPGFPHDDVLLAPFERAPYNGDTPRWSTNTYSIMAEDQWRLSDEWTTFLGFRVDKNIKTKYLVSPRLTVMHMPNSKDTWKFSMGRSQRMTFAEQMRHRWELARENSDSEEMDNLELRYERQATSDLWCALTAYYYDLNVIAWDAGTSYGQNSYGGTTAIGDYQQYGLEAEVTYQVEDFTLMFSHGYTQLLNFHNNTGVTNILSAEPFGYGDDLANWSNHITKLISTYKLTDKWTLSGNSRVYWGFPGAKDYANYVTANNSPYSREPGYDDPYGPSIFVGLGIQYKPVDKMTIRLDGHDLLGLVDKKYNKTLYGFNSFGDYRSSAPSVSLSVSYTF
ncbi:MAG: TonB-dependent receptor [Planctomycetota bacterium]